jgi:hypothetical protein
MIAAARLASSLEVPNIQFRNPIILPPSINKLAGATDILIVGSDEKCLTLEKPSAHVEFDAWAFRFFTPANRNNPVAGTNDCVFDSDRTGVVRAGANPDSAIRSLLRRNPGPVGHSPPTQNVGGVDLNLDMERMYRNLSDYWADSKRSQPATPGGAVIHISSRFIVGALWFIGITAVVSLYFFYQIVLAGIGVKK